MEGPDNDLPPPPESASEATDGGSVKVKFSKKEHMKHKAIFKRMAAADKAKKKAEADADKAAKKAAKRAATPDPTEPTAKRQRKTAAAAKLSPSKQVKTGKG